MDSLKQQLIAARTSAQRETTKDLEIPGYGGRLWVTLRAMDDYTEVRAIVTASATVPDAAIKELHIAADTMVAACVDTYALIDGEKRPLGKRLGLELAGYLEVADGAESDRQALFELFPSTLDVITTFTHYDRWLKGAERDIEARVQGESDAAS